MESSITAPPHHAVHYVNRVGWLRAAVLGANDGIVSTASLMTGIAASGASGQSVLLSGIAALVAGAMSMAAGEYVSVSAQSDTERADLAKEEKALRIQPHAEWIELRDIYVDRGLTPDLAGQVAQQLMDADALGAHARDELGISDLATAPVVAAALTPAATAIPAIVAICLACLALLGFVGARLGGASPPRSVLRTLLWGALAMAVTAGAGHLFGATI